jgi:hypothetical protein
MGFFVMEEIVIIKVVYILMKIRTMIGRMGVNSGVNSPKAM